MSIIDFNPWWETGSIDLKFRKKRFLFKELKESLSKRRIDVIVGLRRVGKTVLIHQLIEHLLGLGVEPKEILYFSFDIEKEDLPRIIKWYEERVLKDRIRDRHVYIFLDEVHKLKGWEDQIKVLYDLNPKAKFVLSGSASLNLIKRAGESLAGRAKFHHLPPLTFKEFLVFSGEPIPKEEDYWIHKRRLDIALARFRGFPETLGMSDREAEEYVREMVLERVLYRDIPESFGVEDLEILRVLARYIAEMPGTILNVDSLSRDLGRHKKTVRNALLYLELSFLIRRLYNLRGSFLAASRKNPKAYPFHPSLAIGRDEDRLFETLIASELNAKYYWRKGNMEVDFVLKNGELIAVEAKNEERISPSDLKAIRRFCKRFGASGYIISREEERTEEGIRIVPATKFLLYMK